MFLLKIFFKLLPSGKCFLMNFRNIFPTFVLTLRQYGGLNHMILHLRVFFLFVLVLVVFGINVMLSWKPLFLSASKLWVVYRSYFLTLFVPGYFIPTFGRGWADLRTPDKILTRATPVLKLLQHLCWSIPSLKKVHS